MNSSVYGKLAVTNLKNNRKTYIPYMLTAILTVMMFYIIDALSRNKSVGDGNLRLCLAWATVVIIVFAVIFLFYTNSFLIKRRKKEIGVYNILGMGKRHIAKMLTIETLIIAVISIVVGLVAGIIFSKLMFLALLKIIHYDVNMVFELSVRALLNTLLLFTVIFAMTLIYNLLQIRLSNPVELLRGGSQGEKEPKTKWLLTIFGVVAIGIGYYIAITTESPLTAITKFFLAVICVIIGTYALFTAGSIALLKLLRKNKNYYYKTSHFTSISGMIYRMKQNAVGLANICILSTMVLVMISTTISLYTGMNDVLETRFPTEFEARNYNATEENMDKIDRIIEEESRSAGVKVKNMTSHRQADLSAIRTGSDFSLIETGNYAAEDLCSLIFISQEEYNRLADENVSIAEDEILVFVDTMDTYGKDTAKIGTATFKVAKELKKFPLAKKSQGRLAPTFYMVVNNEEIMQQFLNEAYADSDMQVDWKEQHINIDYIVTFDLEGSQKACMKAEETIKSRIESETTPSFCDSRELNREGFYMLYGGLLFIGIYLGVMFLMATVLIIYYKQISEGYDDKERYQIMQKVGMSKKEVRHSIRSQVLTVFFLPLITAIIHIIVAFKVITKLLAVLNLVNVSLFMACTIITVVVFAVFYAIVYSLTAREYYKIVN